MIDGSERAEALLDATRRPTDASAGATTAGVSAAQPSLLVLRVLGERVEPVMDLLQAMWAVWRQTHSGLTPCPPRLWRT